MRWTKEEEEKLRKFYFDRSISIKDIIKLLNRSPASIHDKISYLGIKKDRCLKKFKIPLKITSALARIHAHICGDGNLFCSREKDSHGYLSIYKKGKYRYRWGLQYTNNNKLLLKEFIDDVKNTFGLKAYCYNNASKVKSKSLWKFLEELGVGKSHDWSISSKIMKANKEIKKNWIRAFFDDEACFNAGGRIRVRSVNRKSITQVMKMLREFVPSHITPKENYYPDGSVYLNINKNDAEKYFSKIGSLRYRNDKNN